MKRQLYLFLLAMLMAAPIYAQNAQQFYYNQLTTDYDYQAASFVVDTPNVPTAGRAFLLWSKNYAKDPILRGISLDEFDAAGNFISARINPQPQLATEFIQPKKIIKAKLVKGYYLLGYVIRSINTINGFQVFSTPLVIRLDDRLNPIWVYKIHYSVINTANAQSVIEYNDIIESNTSDIILAGRFATASGQPTRLLLTRLNQAGTLIWAYQYPLSNCNAEAFSLAELTNRNIAITGYLEECSTSPSGPRRLLYATFNPIGTPVLIQRVPNALVSEGRKIVRYTNVAGGDQLFITGYIDIVNPTGATNRQVLIVDLRETGAILSTHHIGDAGTEIANDITYRDFGGGSYELYLTGSTGSYYTNVRTEVFFLRVKYSGLSIGLQEFSTFPSLSSNYNARRGLEIKKAGKERYAILGNADFLISPQLRTFTNVFVRDLTDLTSNCIKLHQPPVVKITLDRSVLQSSFPALPFAIYKDNWQQYDKVNPRTECGSFFIDPWNAVLARMGKAILPATPEVKGPVALKVYPNPVKDQLYIEHPSTFTKGVATARIYSTDMRLVKQVALPAGGNRTNVSMEGLPSGLYFLQLQYGSETQLIKIKKD